MGSIYRPRYKDKDGTVRESAVWWIKYYRAGKPYRESTKSTKEADAKRLLKRREGEISEGKLPGIYFDKVRFEELAEDYLVDRRLNNLKALDRAELSVKHLGKDFSGLRVTEITTPVVNGYIERRMAWTCLDCKERFAPQETCPKCERDNLEPGTSNATINRELAALKAMLNLGARQTPPKVARVPYIPMLKENNVRKGFFEPGDFQALLRHLPEYLRGVAAFAYTVGWRLNEIVTLTWVQVDRKQGIVRLEPGETKNDEGRTIYLDEELQAVFEEQWKRRKKLGTALPWVFLNEDGTDRVKRFYKAWKTACKKAGVGVRLFHDFRRTAVRDMVRAGVPERVAMMVSGHKTRSVFDRYNIVDDADLRLAAQRVASYHRELTGKVSGKVRKVVSVNPRAPVAQEDRAPDS